MTIIGIHQPNFLPWIGFWCKYLLSDKFYLLTSVEAPDRGYVTRTKYGAEANKWLTVPVLGKRGMRINELLIADHPRSVQKLAKTLEHTYCNKRYPYHYRIESIINAMNHSTTNQFWVMSWVLLDLIRIELGFPKKWNNFSISHEKLDILTPTQRLFSIVEHQHGTIYLSGPDGPQYMKKDEIPHGYGTCVQDITKIDYKGSIIEKMCLIDDIQEYIASKALFNPAEW